MIESKGLPAQAPEALAAFWCSCPNVVRIFEGDSGMRDMTIRSGCGKSLYDERAPVTVLPTSIINRYPEIAQNHNCGDALDGVAQFFCRQCAAEHGLIW